MIGCGSAARAGSRVLIGFRGRRRRDGVYLGHSRGPMVGVGAREPSDSSKHSRWQTGGLTLTQHALQERPAGGGELWTICIPRWLPGDATTRWQEMRSGQA
ncbi:unnamed protein product [Pleuronectes platessa]|uniref:Uncharacterized protein n=1 Tax=Pleuronectes platessa TaxID=8262 RepID=A0A9N7Y668_PLEPL|nr:unnamed protein product [Pleuronectes platessa]